MQLFIPQWGHFQSRQYSLSEAPREDGQYYRISVKKEPAADAGFAPGVVSNLLHDSLTVGDEVEVSHPQGEFFVDPSDKSKEGVPAILISAGVGATPMMSILGALAPEDKKPGGAAALDVDPRVAIECHPAVPRHRQEADASQ